MMRSLYNEKQNSYIMAHEEAMLEAYKRIARSYMAAFQDAGCTLDVFLWWTDSKTAKYSRQRLPFQRGYLCYIACEVRRNGEVERVKSDDGEADYYNLEAYWPVSALEGRFFRTYVFLYDTMDGVREEIDSLLGLLERDNA